jgi:hypothetical protein
VRFAANASSGDVQPGSVPEIVVVPAAQPASPSQPTNSNNGQQMSFISKVFK